MIEALRELGNVRDDHGLPSMGLDHMRLEVAALKAGLTANDNHQPTRET